MTRGSFGITALAAVALAAMCVSVQAYTLTVSFEDCMAQKGAYTFPASTLERKQLALKTDLIGNGVDSFTASVLSGLFYTTMPQETTSGDYCYSHAKRMQLAALNDLGFGADAKPFIRDEATWTAMLEAENAFLNNILAMEANGTTTRTSAGVGVQLESFKSRGLLDDLVWDPLKQLFCCASSGQCFVHQLCAQEACANCDTVWTTNIPTAASGCGGWSQVVQNGLNEPPSWSKRSDWRRRMYLNCLAETVPSNNAVDWALAGVGDALSFSSNSFGNACPVGVTWSFALAPNSCTHMQGH
ncbi:hypothetical protein FVE85_6446 [Porphyridium purpureum]|uniref:Uncharacterized protein n=1 Tax=Porphyridium purpureum TaxID=35688 RepID=A0A5J4Z4R9_PORPP|nr:hypothetical protein FVE85_6446 [Porphyridium purpureum]|eukprot:POR0874..scf295_1